MANKINKKSQDKIDIFDLYAIKIKVLCKRKLSHRQEFIKAVEEFVINSSNIENMTILSYVTAQMSNIFLGPSFAKYIGPPELNLESGNFNIFDSNKEMLFNNNADYEEIGNLDKILEDERIKDNIKEYIIEKYEESNK